MVNQTDILYWLEQIASKVAEVSTSIDNKNKPIVVTDITALTKEQLDALNPGDLVIKQTGHQKHTYMVSYKGEGAGEGICISYNAAGYGETVSYDRSGSGWVYNSTDIKTYGE